MANKTYGEKAAPYHINISLFFSTKFLRFPGFISVIQFTQTRTSSSSSDKRDGNAMTK